MRAPHQAEFWASDLTTSPVSLAYSRDECLRPDIVTDGLAHAAALELKDAYPEGALDIAELGVGVAPYLCLIARHIPKSQPVHLEGVDIDAGVIEYATYNLDRNLSYRANPDDSYSLQVKPWEVTLAGMRKRHAIAINPPYLPNGSQVREQYRRSPVTALYVPNSVDGLDHYRKLMPVGAAEPGLRDNLRPNGVLAIRTPRECAAYEAIRDIVSKHFKPTEADRTRYTIHDVVVASELGERTGRGLIVRAAEVAPSRYVTGLVRCMGMWTWKINMEDPVITRSGFATTQSLGTDGTTVIL